MIELDDWLVYLIRLIRALNALLFRLGTLIVNQNRTKGTEDAVNR